MNRLIPLKFANLWLTCLMLALTILILPVKSNATIFHVSKTGNDLGAGTSSSPFQTITKGVSLLSAGDTLFVHSGTYAESILSWKTKIPNGKSWDQPIIVAAYPGDTVTINGFRARNDSNNGMLRELITADGRKFGMFGPQEAGGSR